MKKYYFIIALITLLLYCDNTMAVCDCILLSQEYSDEDWEEWMCDSLDNNVEISEMRNEYLFCQLSLQSYDRFLNYLYNLINTHPHLKIIIANELKNPVSDVIDLNLCIEHISKSRTKKSFKKWMIRNIKHKSCGKKRR